MPDKGEAFIYRGLGSVQNGAIVLFISYITEMLSVGLPGNKKGLSASWRTTLNIMRCKILIQILGYFFAGNFCFVVDHGDQVTFFI
jgi:hypothetical protein